MIDDPLRRAFLEAAEQAAAAFRELRNAVEALNPIAGAITAHINLAEAPVPAVQPHYLNRKDAAAHVGLSGRTLEKLAIEGGGPPFSKVGTRVLYNVELLNEWMRSRTHTSTSSVAASRTKRSKRRD